MKPRILLPLAFAIAVGVPAAAGAVAAMPKVHHRALHHKFVVAHMTTPALVPDLRATALARPEVYPSARPWGYPYNTHETEGLSRNPDDCASHGCIDNN